MILGIDPDTKVLSWPKGSPYLVRLKFSDGAGGFLDLTGRALRFAAYRASGTVVHEAPIVVVGDMGTVLFDGSVSLLTGLDGASWQVAQLFDDGATPLFRGSIYVTSAAAEQGTGTGPPPSDLLTWEPATQTLIVSPIGARGPSLSEELGTTPEALIADLVTGPVDEKLAEVDALIGNFEQVQILADILIPSGATAILADSGNSIEIGGLM